MSDSDSGESDLSVLDLYDLTEKVVLESKLISSMYAFGNGAADIEEKILIAQEHSIPEKEDEGETDEYMA